MNTKVIAFKTLEDGSKLQLHIYEPEIGGKGPRPAILFFFGGGYKLWQPFQFSHHAEYLAARGMVAVCAEYRVSSTHGTTPLEAMSDGRAAMRWLRRHSEALGIDPDKIVAAGGSAGGHLALSLSHLTHLAEQDGMEEQECSSRPNALVLFNPSVAPEEKRGEEAKYVSPLQYIREGLPPVIILQGKADHTTPYASAEKFAHLMKENGNDCELVGYEGKQHGFFNYDRDPDHKYYYLTVQEMDRFLVAHGFLEESR